MDTNQEALSGGRPREAAEGPAPGSATVVVLGAGGALGGAVARLLDAPRSGARSVRVDREPPPTADAGRWVVIDLAAAPASEIRDVLEGAAAAVNCAEAHDGDPGGFADENARIAANVVEAIAGMRRPPRLVHIGSGEEYGTAAVHGRAILETDRPRPAGPYGRSKLRATRVVTTAAAAQGVDAVVLRVFDLVGPGVGEHTFAGGVARDLQRAIAAAAGPLVCEAAGGFRDLVDVRDAAAAAVRACRRDGVAGEILNVGSGRAVAERGVIDELARVSGYRGEVVTRPRRTVRPGPVSWQEADLTRVGAMLGWRPRIDLPRSLADLWRSLDAPGAPAARADRVVPG